MPERPDALEALRRPITPLAPPSEFAASLRRRLEQELGMTVTDRFVSPSVEVDGTLAMVHLRVGDADRAMRFFGALFGWQAERVPFEGHISHYTVNTDLTLRILDDPSAPPVVPNYRVTDVDGAVRSIERAGGRVEASEVTPDGGGWVRGEDDQGVPLLLLRPGRYHRSAPPAQAASGEVGLVFIRADAGRAERFYRATLGWHLERVHPASNYFEAVALVGVFDEAAAFGREVTPSATLYLSVAALRPVLSRIEQLGGRSGQAAQDMGPYFTAMCSDDQGTEFGLMAETMD